MIEDPNPPAYEPLALNDDVETAATGPNKPLSGTPNNGHSGKPITSSVRATHRLLESVGGFRGRFRGIMAAFALAVSGGIIAGFFNGVGLPRVVGTLLASLALVQLSTAWIHIIMTVPNPLPFWRRLPALGRTFKATYLPVLVNSAALSAAYLVPLFTAHLLGLEIWDPSHPKDMPKYHSEDAWRSLVVWLVSLAVHLLLVLPSEVALVRVQASLLSPEEQTIIPFDATFQGKVEPAVVDGKGYVSMRDALTTFSRASWIRLYKMYLKVFVISTAAMFGIAMCLTIQMVIVMVATRK